MFGFDNNVLMGLVGVVLVFCLMTNKKSFKSLMKGNTLVIIGLTLLLLVCCMNKGGRVVEGIGDDNNPMGFTIMDLGQLLTQVNSENVEDFCGSAPEYKLCHPDMITLINSDNTQTIIHPQHIVRDNIDRLRAFLTFLKDNGMGGVENVEHNLNAVIDGL